MVLTLVVGVAEETAGAGASVPRALVWAVGSSAVLGYLNVVALMFSVQACPPSCSSHPRNQTPRKMLHVSWCAITMSDQQRA